MKINKSSMIVLGVTAAMVLVAVVGVYVPQGRKLQQIKADTDARRAAIAADSQKIAVLPELSREVQTLKDRYQDFDRKLPKNQDSHEFVRQINTSLTSAALTNQSIELGHSSREPNFSMLPVNLKFHGSFLSLAAFLDHLDRMQRIWRVQKMTIGREEKEGELGIELQMAIYFTES